MIDLDFNVAIEDVTTYRDQMVSTRDAMNKGEKVSQDERTDLQIKYELLVRAYADAVGMHEPDEREWHKHTVKYDNPAEWAVKEGSFFSLNNGIMFLNRLIGRLKYYKTHPDQFATAVGKPNIETALVKVQQAIHMFDTSAKILAERRKGKQSLLISDEYDAQDILHCILKPQFPDITPEEYSPPVARGKKRIDLVIPSARIVIELKIVFEKNKTSRVVDELKVDIESYHSYPACSTLVGFIYNPNNAVVDPERIVRDLSGTRTKGNHVFEVIVEIYPR